MKRSFCFYVYIATNNRHTVLYTGITNNILQRQFDHEAKTNKNSFTAKYNVSKIVYYEFFSDVRIAIAREKQIKAGSRQRKICLINNLNPEWRDLIKEEDLSKFIK